ncbi:alpha/beta hydrolase [Paenibacillus sp. Marseille-Q4541]|uniref:alpha/beta hydrolase n=1 Tax=Paenibacillus sp. Marseille-Q4541 TaxID=2831522 RepID=UPI001BAD4834|nr:alpha/beta hydrolase [Paenibacillus sp. Marseille-Q4541]
MSEIFIWPGQPPYAAEGYENDKPTLTPYLVEGAKSAVIICPGGGYRHLAPHEGEPVAKWLNEAGISAFVLKYRIFPHKEPAPLADARRAIQYVRARAEEYVIEKNRIAILGFSAGGHLTANAGTSWIQGRADAEDPIDFESSRPDAMILCYPVITMEDYGHLGSREALLGEKASSDLVQKYSTEKQVKKDTPPAFIWHTFQDEAVPVQNSLAMSMALSHFKVPHELHVFEEGHHGIGLAEDLEESSGKWKELCITWLRKQGW